MLEQAGEALTDLIVTVKDNFCTKDLPTTCASAFLKNYRSPYDATVVELIRKSRAVLIGKTNMDEFAMGSNNTYSIHGPALNPLYSEARSPGGSSGGSAAAVAAGFCDVGVGSDTGGSVRLPAAYCSIFGFKPSYGLISRYGLVSYAQSLDTVGIHARELAPLRQLFDILNKPDDRDPSCASERLREQIKEATKRRREKLKVGVIAEANIDCDVEVRAAWMEVLNQLIDAGHEVYIVSMPILKHALSTYYMLAPAEAASNLARYDGVRYGSRASADKDSEGVLYAPTRNENFGPEVQRRVLLGTFNVRSEAFDDHFLKAQKVRRLIQNEFNRIFRTTNVLCDSASSGSLDIIVQPTTNRLPPLIESTDAIDTVDEYLTDILTVPANLAGLPAISLPRSKSIGIQVCGQYGDDLLVLDVAEYLSSKLNCL